MPDILIVRGYHQGERAQVRCSAGAAGAFIAVNTPSRFSVPRSEAFAASARAANRIFIQSPSHLLPDHRFFIFATGECAAWLRFLSAQ